MYVSNEEEPVHGFFVTSVYPFVMQDPAPALPIFAATLRVIKDTTPYRYGDNDPKQGGEVRIQGFNGQTFPLGAARQIMASWEKAIEIAERYEAELAPPTEAPLGGDGRRDYLVDIDYTAPPYLPTWSRKGDPSLNSDRPNVVRLIIAGGGRAEHTIHPKYGIAWCIRHARGIYDYDLRCWGWQVIRGMDQVQIAGNSRRGRPVSVDQLTAPFAGS